jgi:hypothetical protein
MRRMFSVWCVTAALTVGAPAFAAQQAGQSTTGSSQPTTTNGEKSGSGHKGGKSGKRTRKHRKHTTTKRSTKKSTKKSPPPSGH